MSKVIHLKDVVGKGYKDFWNNTQRYRVLKGGRGSKKSTTTTINFISRLREHPDANLLVIRQVFKDHKDSTYAQLKWAARQLGAYEEFDLKVSPMEVIRKSTGQKILFRGLDDSMSVTSATVEYGYLCWAWFEEAFQVRKEDDFNKIDMSIRGYTGGLFKQITLTFNPWSEKHWLNKRFFKSDAPNVFTKTTKYLCNEFLDEADIELFEEMKVKSPRRYKIEGLGEWELLKVVFTKTDMNAYLIYLKSATIQPGQMLTFKKVSKSRDRSSWGWHWSGTFTADADIAIYRGEQHMRPQNQVADGLKKGQFLNFDHLFMNSKSFRVKYAQPSAVDDYFFMPVGHKKTGIGFATANKNGDLWGTVTNWHKKEAVK